MAGCTSSSQTGIVNVKIVNLTGSTKSVRVKITDDDDTIWKQTADIPRKQSENPSKVETENALSDIEEESSFEVSAEIAERQDAVTASLVVDDTGSDPVKSVVIRITEENRIDIATPHT